MQIDLEATHPTEDSNLRMASFTAVPHDLGRAPAHASGLSSELPSLWWGSRGLLPPLFPMAVGSRGMAGGRLSVTSHEAFWSSLPVSFFRREADFQHAVGNLDPQE